MKRLLIVLCILGAIDTIHAANTCTWIGTSGNWSDSANWQDGIKPTSGAGDTVILTCASADAAITNDMGEVTLAKLTFETPNAVTLRGDAIRLTSYLLTHQAAIIDNNLFIDGKVSFNCGEKTYGSTYRPTFNGTITLASGKDLYLFGNSGAIFNSTISGRESTLYFGPTSVTYRWDSGGYLFYGPVIVKHFCQHDYSMSSASFYSTSNSWEKISHRYGVYYYFYNAGSLPSSGAIDFISTGDRRSPYRGFFLRADQTVGSLFCSGTCPVVNYGSYDKRSFNWIRNDGTKTITLTLRPTCDAKTSCAIRMYTSDINLVYDPEGNYTQEFTESTLDSRTSITVKNGTLKFTGDTLAQSYKTLTIADGATFDLDVTNSAALKSITTITLGKDARLKIGASTIAPFSMKPTVKMDTGAKLIVAEGTSIEIGNCTTPNGLVQPVDTYTGSGATGTTASWIEGGGTVSVATSTTSYIHWRSATDGTWNESAKWVGDAVPGAGKPVAIARDGASFTVSVNETSAAPTGLVLENDTADCTTTLKIAAPMTLNVTASSPLSVNAGGRIVVTNNTTLKLAADKTYTDPMHLRDGGTLEVIDSNLTIGYLAGRFNISGSTNAESLLKVSSGTCLVNSTSSTGHFYLGENGRIAITNGLFYCPGYTSYYRTFEFAGGTLDLSGDAQFWTAIARTPYQGYGTINLTDNATFCTHKTSSIAWQSRVYFDPIASTDILTINVTDHAKFDVGNAIETDLGGEHGGKVQMRLTSDQTHHFGAWGIVGSGTSQVTLTLEDGMLKTGTYGFKVGSDGDTERFSAPYHSNGRFVMSGGKLFVYADSGAQAKNAPIFGLIIGYAPIVTNGTFAGSTASGRLELSGGEITNVYGYTQIGYGAATGCVVQTGGFFGTANNKSMAIGAYSGQGEWIISNGTAQVRGQLYLGGVVSNDFNLANCGCPEGIGGSRGRLEVSGGTFNSYQLHAGTDRGLGSAEIEVGLAGTLNVWNTLLNNVKLVRKLGDTGTGAFNILANNIGSSGNLTITEKASLVIDARVLTKQKGAKFTLLSYAGTRTGDFAAANVTWVGFTRPDKWSLQWVGKTLRCSYHSGFVLHVR